MHRSPLGPQRSPGAPRPAPGWTFPGVRSPFGGSPRYRGAGFSPGSGPNRGSIGGSPGQFGSGRPGFGGPGWRGSGFRRPRSFSPSGAPNQQSRSADVPVEKFFSPMMLQDPWKNLQPITAEAAAARTA